MWWELSKELYMVKKGVENLTQEKSIKNADKTIDRLFTIIIILYNTLWQTQKYYKHIKLLVIPRCIVILCKPGFSKIFFMRRNKYESTN